MTPDTTATTPNLGPPAFAAGDSPFEIPFYGIDAAALLLFRVPDSAAGLGWRSGDAQYLAACRSAHRLAARWLGELRPLALEVVQGLIAYADAARGYTALQADLAAAESDPARRAAADASLNALQMQADSAGRACRAVAAAFADADFAKAFPAAAADIV